VPAPLLRGGIGCWHPWPAYPQEGLRAQGVSLSPGEGGIAVGPGRHGQWQLCSMYHGRILAVVRIARTSICSCHGRGMSVDGRRWLALLRAAMPGTGTGSLHGLEAAPQLRELPWLEHCCARAAGQGYMGRRPRHSKESCAGRSATECMQLVSGAWAGGCAAAGEAMLSGVLQHASSWSGVHGQGAAQLPAKPCWLARCSTHAANQGCMGRGLRSCWLSHAGWRAAACTQSQWKRR